jgi:hypothetical protein
MNAAGGGTGMAGVRVRASTEGVMASTRLIEINNLFILFS